MVKELSGDVQFIIEDITTHDLRELSPEIIKMLQPTFDRILRIGSRVDKKERGELTNAQRAHLKAYMKALHKGEPLPPSPHKKRGYKKKCHPEDSGEKLD